MPHIMDEYGVTLAVGTGAYMSNSLMMLRDAGPHTAGGGG